MSPTTLTLHPSYPIAPVEPYLNHFRKNYPIDVLNFFGLPQDGLRKNFREWVFSLVSVGPVKSGMNPEEFIFDVDQEK
jgi:hypothetical protein